VRTLRTQYHQSHPFFDGGRKVLLRTGVPKGQPGLRRNMVLDLSSGMLDGPLPTDWFASHRQEATGRALYYRKIDDQAAVVLWDLQHERELASFYRPEWGPAEARLLADGRHVVIGQHQGKPYDEPVHSQFFVMDDTGHTEMLFDAEGYFCNHIQANPAEPTVFAYDRWPCPRRRAEQVIYVMAIDGTYHEMLPLLENTLRPGSIWGGQRDHYLWTPDGKRIASYVSPKDMPESGDHFDYGWWLSVTDWRSGEDLCVEYPPERWGCNFTVSPDSRYIVTAGGRGFECIYLVEIERLRDGWNEQVLCRYPHSVEDGFNRGPFHMPHVLPDQSGVIFSAGWPGDEDGVYLVEWPRDSSTT
jgi:hypothetical protein